MQLLRFLILFALVNVLVAEELDKKKLYLVQVHTINNYIEQIPADALTEVIKKIVYGDYTMVEVAFMLVAPETRKDIGIGHEAEEDVAKHNEMMESVELNCETQNDVANEPETQEYVPKKPEKLWYQRQVQSQLEGFLGEKYSDELSKDEIKELDLPKLGDIRRMVINDAVKQLIEHQLSRIGPFLLSEEIDSEMCRMLGLRMSLVNARWELPLIESAIIRNGICVLSDLDGKETQYKMSNGILIEFREEGYPTKKIIYELPILIHRSPEENLPTLI